jgi:phospholipase C
MQSLRRFLPIAFSIAAVRESMLGQNQRESTPTTKTPIKYLVVIFDENNSFDHYFGTYPAAMNPPDEPAFYARSRTPAVNGLTPELRAFNPNSVQPFRLDRADAVTCDNDNHYTDEQAAYDGGLLDNFSILSAVGSGCTPNLEMGYYDGNTVTAIWNYAQHFAMSDNFFASTFGTTVMGHLNLISGQTHGATPASISGKVVEGSIIANVNPTLDDCSTGSVVTMGGRNIGDLLNVKGVSWGWFYGDWMATSSGNAECSAIYNAHYLPFSITRRLPILTTARQHHWP